MANKYLKKIWRTETRNYHNCIVHNIETRKALLDGLNEPIDITHYSVIVGNSFLDLTLSLSEELKKGQKVEVEERTNYFLGIPILNELRVNGDYAKIHEETNVAGTRIYLDCMPAKDFKAGFL